MKKILIGLLLLASFNAFAQFPVGVKTPGQYPDLATLAKLGTVYKASTALNSTPVTQYPSTPVICTYGQALPGIGIQSRAGRVNYIQNVSFDSNGPITARWLFAQNGINYSVLNNTANGFDFVCGSEGIHRTKDISSWSYEFGQVSLNVWALGTTIPNYAADIQVIKLTNDFDWLSPFKVLITGDSITEGAIGNDANGNPYYGRTLWAFRVKSLLIKNGIPNQIVNKGIPGSTSNDFYNGVMAGVYDCGAAYNWNLIYVSFGANDANGTAGTPAVSVSQYTFNLGTGCDSLHARYPKASIVVLGQTDSDIPALRANSGAFRTAAQGVVAARKSSTYDIFYYDQSQAFSMGISTTDLNVSTVNRPLGTQLHPSGLGHQLMTQNTNADSYNGIAHGGIWPVTQLTKAYINKGN